MKSKRRLQLESLESRRLLAAACRVLEAPMETPAILEPASSSEGETTRFSLDHAGLIGDFARPDIYLGLPYGPDLIHEQGNRVYAVDQRPYSAEEGTLYVFERADDGSLEEVAQVELGFSVERMIVRDDRVVLVGNNHDWWILANRTAGEAVYAATAVDRPDILPPPEIPQTVAVTVHLGAEVEVVRQTFDGLFHEIHEQDDRLVVVSSVGHDATIAIYPPPLVSGLVTTYDITADGLSKVASTQIPLFGTTSVNGRDFYSAHTEHDNIFYLTPDGDPNAPGIRAPDEPIEPTAHVSRYLLGDDAISEVDSLDLGPGFLTHFEVAPDGLTAVAVRSRFNGAGPSMVVDLLDLSGDGVKVFESIQLDQSHGRVMVGGPDYVVLRDFESHALVVIDANQQIDISSDARVRRVELPTSLHVHDQSLLVSEDRLVLVAERPVDPATPPTTDAGEVLVPRLGPNVVLLTVSLSQSQIIADTELPDSLVLPHGPLYSIDSANERFGFVVLVAEDAHTLPTRFLYGRLTESGEFVRDGAIPMGWWLEIDVTPDRLIARESDRLLEYDWDNPEDPVITPLGDLEPPIEAVNDDYRLNANGEDHVLEVLANDVIGHFGIGPRVEIVELIGAPDGAEIVRGRAIRIPADALQGVDNLRFEYVISNGRESSSAVVEIDVRSISQEQVQELVEAVRRQAAEDFGVPEEEIQITFVERIFNQPLPVVLPGQPEIDLSPGILVTLTAPGVSALYAASLDGQIIQVFGSRQELLVDLGLRAIDDDGNTLDSVAEGDRFWLEFNAKDLRDFGLGVYAAFFDLLIPTEHLVITGPIEYGPGFTGIPGGDFAEGEIDDLGAIGNVIQSPGNERQQILRIGVEAVGAGEITLQPEPSDQRGTETLLRGRETEVPLGSVRYSPLTLTIVESAEGNPLDADGNGEVTAADALVVINFLGRFGTTDLVDLEATVRGVRAEGEQIGQDEMDAMRRYDTSGNGTISALDALVVINGLGQLTLADEMAEGEDDDHEDWIDPLAGLTDNRLF